MKIDEEKQTEAKEEKKEPKKPTFGGLKALLAKQNEENAEMNKNLPDEIKKIEEGYVIH